MPELKSANSARPGSLKSPVPGKTEELSADSLLAELDIPEISTGTEPTADALLAETSEPMPQGEFPVQEPSSSFGVNTDIKQQLADMPVRIAANIAGDPGSVKLTLEKRLGKENVKMKGDTFYFKQPGEKAFRKLDPSTFEVVNDLFSDFYKESIQLMGGGMGTLTPAGFPLGTVGGVATATAGVNAYGESVLGVVKDPALFKNQDPGKGGQVSRGLERTGMAIAEGAEYVAAEGALKAIGSRLAARRAKTQGLRQLEEVSPTERLQESVKSNLETLEELRGLGLTKKIEGTDIEIPAHQLLPHFPEVSKVASSLGAERAFQQAQKEASENFGTATLNLVEEAAGISRGKLSNAVRTGVPSAKEVSAADVNGLFNSVRRSEGALIGKFREKVRKEMRQAPLPVPNTQKALGEIFEKIQIKADPTTGKLVFPNDESLMQILGTDSQAFVNGFKGDLNRFYKNTNYGFGNQGLTIDDLLGESQIMGAKNEGARRVGGIYKSMIGKLSSAIRADSRENMAKVLSPEDAVEYAASMGRFSKLSKSMDQLDSYLRDDIGMNTFARGLVNKGKEGLANLRATKEFLLQENPEMYKNLIGEYMEELALKHRKPGNAAGFDPAAMKKELLGLGGEYLDELFPKNGPINKGIVLRTFDLADQVQRSAIKGTDEELLKDTRKAVSALSAWHRNIGVASGIFNAGTKDKRLLKMLSREGVESFLADVPKKNKPKMRQTLNAVLSISRKAGVISTVNSAQPTPGRLPGPEQEQ